MDHRLVVLNVNFPLSYRRTRIGSTTECKPPVVKEAVANASPPWASKPGRSSEWHDLL